MKKIIVIGIEDPNDRSDVAWRVGIAELIAHALENATDVRGALQNPAYQAQAVVLGNFGADDGLMIAKEVLGQEPRIPLIWVDAKTPAPAGAIRLPLGSNRFGQKFGQTLRDLIEK